MEVTTHTRIGYFGPAGTYTEQALLSQPDLAAATRTAYATVPDVLDAVSAREVDRGIVPIENSIEGTVNFTQDALVFDHELLIQREIVLDIQHCLLARPGTTLAQVRAVCSIPVATAQCHGFLRRSLPGVELRATNSTVEAAQLVASSPEPLAAIASARVAAAHGLAVLMPEVADHAGNQTRFVLVGRGGIPAPTGHDRTAIVVFQRADEPGSLISILQEFAVRRINLSQLLSRPTKRGGLGDYCFVIYLDGHVADELVADALRELYAKQGVVKFLGSYPASGVHAHDARTEVGARWRDAEEWMTGLRAHVSR